MFSERNGAADLETIIAMFQALGTPDPDWLFADLAAPVLVVSVSRDKAHQSAFELRDRLPYAEMVTMEGAGHACLLEQPWLFDDVVIRFLRAQGVHPA